jgi:hypothetical protein
VRYVLPPPPGKRASSVVRQNNVNTNLSAVSNESMNSSLHGGSEHSRGSVGSVTSVLWVDFPNDNKCQKVLRYVRLLPPTPRETPANRRIRVFIWISLVLDIICAIVAITTYSKVTTCCGKAVWSMGGSLDWSKAMRVITYLYILGILIEFLPVVRQAGIPWNIFNPMFGFLLTFAVFFDDSRAEAISMWILETIAIVFDFMVYRLKAQKRMSRLTRLDEIDELVSKQAKKGKNALGTSSAHSTRSTRSHVSSFNVSLPDGMAAIDGTLTSADHKEIKLLRERRKIRLKLQTDQFHINYHLTGVVVNAILIVITGVMIISMLTTGGMCVVEGDLPNPFSRQQLEKCPNCRDVAGQCQICSATTSECYYPY